jgi:hypothetical protein
MRAQVGGQGEGFDSQADAGVGFQIVGAVSDAWGLNGGDEVWFEIGRAG